VDAYVPEFKKTTLENGVRILSESHTGTRCVVVGFWLDRGTRDEDLKMMGVSHLIEHMVFKGTKKLSTFQIAQKIEAVGGEINAFTTKEHTCFHTTTLSEDLEMSMDILSQLFHDAVFDASEFEKEKSVVLQELLMSKDDIEDAVFDEYFEKAFPKNPLGWPIIGTEKSLSKMTSASVTKWYRDNYLAGNLIISVAGDVKHEDAVRYAEKYIGHLPKACEKPKRTTPKFKPLMAAANRKSEQVHIVMGLPSIPYNAPNRFDSYLVNACLGGGMTSRLYQNIREDKGWAYSVFSMLNTYTDFGIQLIYAATDRRLHQKVVEEMVKELRFLRKHKLKQDELDFYLRQVRGQLLIAAEDVESRMNSLAVNEMTFGEYRSVESVIAEMDSVTLKRVNHYIQEYLDIDALNLFVMGNIDEAKTKKWMKAL
jgi:predicted Zn-dependent peptidase